MRVHQRDNLIGSDARVFRYGLLPSALKVLFNGYQKVFMDIYVFGVKVRYGFFGPWFRHQSL